MPTANIAPPIISLAYFFFIVIFIVIIHFSFVLALDVFPSKTTLTSGSISLLYLLLFHLVKKY